ncbi:MFS transporter [Methylobacterium komagatae]|uniref:MFS transporter n=1 Tax=Methylobacterium komagatae TaxID=374425 RepID=A0ABW2BMP1_9HYPH
MAFRGHGRRHGLRVHLRGAAGTIHRMAGPLPGRGGGRCGDPVRPQAVKGVVPGATAAGANLGTLFRGYRDLLVSTRGRRTYAYVFLNSVFHSGVFTWLGLYFERRYGLGPVGVGLALLGYGIPGFLLGPIIGRVADQRGRGRLLPLGLFLGAVAAAALILDVPLLLAVVAVTVLSLGYDMTQPLFAGIVTALGGQRPGQAMGLNVCLLFTGFGLGSLLFGSTLRLEFGPVLAAFAAAELALAVVALLLFRSEVPPAEGGRP